MNTASILQDILQLKEQYKQVFKDLMTINTGYDVQSVEKTRRFYDKTWTIITAKKEELQQSQREIADSMQNLKECETLLTDMKNLYINIENKLNKARVGTLFGIARQKIKENIGDYDVEGNEPVDFVMQQPYDESAAIRSGGRYKMTLRSRKKRVSKTRKRLR
jgi:hypothetical protein